MHRPYGCGGFHVAVIRGGRVLFLCGGRHRGRPGDASRVTIAESYRTGVPLRSIALRATDASPLRARGFYGRGNPWDRAMCRPERTGDASRIPPTRRQNTGWFWPCRRAVVV